MSSKSARNRKLATDSPSSLEYDHFRLVADATYDWESWHHRDGHVMWINPAVERITGRTVAECMAMPRYPLPMIFEGDLARVAEIYSGFANRTCGNDIEFRIRHRDEHIAFVAISWQPMFDEKGDHLGCRTSIRDISERQELRAQITRYNEHLEQLVQEKTDKLQILERRRAQLEKLAALGQLAAGMAHEINNPLAGIRNAFQLIRADLPEQAASFPLLDLVDREIERLAGMVRNMFHTCRKDSEQSKPFELQQVIGHVIQMLKSTAAGRGVSLILEPSDRLAVELPEGQIKQVLYNLGRNAIQACSSGQTVRFSAVSKVNRIQLVVADNGIGIDPEMLPLIFEPYFSSKNSVSEPSMGLGLSICQRLIKSMGGSIIVHTQLGQGSRFIVELPQILEQNRNASFDSDDSRDDEDF